MFSEFWSAIFETPKMPLKKTVLAILGVFVYTPYAAHRSKSLKFFQAAKSIRLQVFIGTSRYPSLEFDNMTSAFKTPIPGHWESGPHTLILLARSWLWVEVESILLYMSDAFGWG